MMASVPVLITVEIPNTEVRDTWVVRNVGHPVTGDHPDDDDMRKYLVTDPDGGEFTIDHSRSLGHRSLVRRVLCHPHDRADPEG